MTHKSDTALYKLSSRLKGKGHKEFTAIEFLLLVFLADYDEEKELQECRELAAGEYLELMRELDKKVKMRRTIEIETSQFSTNPTKRWVGLEYLVEDVVVEYPDKLDYLDDDKLLEMADNEENGVHYVDVEAAQQSELCSCGSSINANVVLGDGVVRCTVCRRLKEV